MATQGPSDADPAAKRCKPGATSAGTVVIADSADKIPTAPVGGKITVVYWNMCGLGQSIRLALEVAGVEYVDVRVTTGPGEPGTDGYKQTWLGKKPALGKTLTFPNLPYLLDGDVALVQSSTILRYLARKFNLFGDASVAHLVDLVLDQATDFDKEFWLPCYGNFASLKPYCEKELPGRLEQWSTFLGTKPFLTGEQVTVADIRLYEILRKFRLLEDHPEIGTKSLKQFPTLEAFLDRVEALPQLQAYFKSPAYMPRPLNNPHAHFV